MNGEKFFLMKHDWMVGWLPTTVLGLLVFQVNELMLFLLYWIIGAFVCFLCTWDALLFIINKIEFNLFLLSFGCLACIFH